MTDQERLLGRIYAVDAREAHEYLHDLAARLGFAIRYKTSGKVWSVDLKAGRRHLFSWIPASRHLLFYIRKPALGIERELGSQASRNHRGLVKRNRENEITVRIENRAEAVRLASWLFADIEPFGLRSLPAGPVPDPLQLADDMGLVRRAFDEWHRAMLADARREGSRWWLPVERIAFTEAPAPSLALSISPTDIDNAVHINLPVTAGSENGLSAVGLDADGNRYLLRQARLQPNKISSELIRDAEFAKRTGLAPAPVTRDGGPASRTWHLVTPLDGISAEEIRARTADFVSRCWSARTWDASAEHDQERLVELFGRDEMGGTYTFLATGGEKLVRRKQGDVWLALRELLERHNIAIDKPRDAQGYEVDGVIHAPGRPILVEIKTSVSAADVYTGVGQLLLYPQLLDRMQAYRRILLVPDGRRSALLEAVGACGVELHTYTPGATGDTKPMFSAPFLRLCGVTPPTEA